ncbi:MAG: DUF393 domain-containing protein [Kiritimatiellae bacterium]|nr:DUF393 domain-containing protein [Kiritimatiellia bacterium]
MELHPVILFDGDCRFCHRAVQFVLKRDRAGVFRFAALDSAYGQAQLAAHGLADPRPDSLVLIEDDSAFIESEGALRIARRLGGGWRWLSGLILLPRVLRDPVYRWIARNRFRWFGKADRCSVPDPAFTDRFLDQ